MLSYVMRNRQVLRLIMKMILLVTLLIHLRTFATGEAICNPSNYNLKYTTDKQSYQIEEEVMATCINKSNNMTYEKEVNVDPRSICCEFEISTQDTSATAITQTDATNMDMTTQPICNSQVTGSEASIGLGVVVGLLVALLAVVTTGWMWTCWTMRRKSRSINLRYNGNPSYGGNQLTLQNHPLPTPTPTYETIPPLNNFMYGIKLDLAEPKKEGCDVSNNREEAYQKLNKAQRDNQKRESTDQIHTSGQREGYQGKERVTKPSSGTSLQEIRHSNTNTNTELLFESSLPDEERQSANSMEIGTASQENEIVNSSVKKDNKELDGTTLKHNHNQTETREKEQDLPKKRAAPREYELAVPSK